MRITIIITFCLNGLLLSAKNEAYYLSNYFGDADLFLVDMDLNQDKQAFSFKDTFIPLDSNEIQTKLSNFLMLTISLNSNEEQSKSLLLTTGKNANYMDSIEVAGKWYKIILSDFDDGFIGGMPNRINQSIAVEGIGVIYSYSRYTEEKKLFMLAHNDPTKQKVLTALYNYLIENHFFLIENRWDKMKHLSEKYSFKNYPSVLINKWSSIQNHLKIVSSQSEPINGETQYIVSIKNVSNARYVLPKDCKVGPAKATIYYEDRINNWNLLNTHYGRHYRNLDRPKYLGPGETINFTPLLSTKITCGACTHMTYSGFQLYRYPYDFLTWLLDDKEEFEGEYYTKYPFRSIRE